MKRISVAVWWVTVGSLAAPWPVWAISRARAAAAHLPVVHWVAAQEQPPKQPPTDAPKPAPDSAKTEPPPAKPAEAVPPPADPVAQFVSSILDPKAEFAARKTVAELLLKNGTSEAFHAAADLMAADKDLAIRRAVCEAIVKVAGEQAGILGSDHVAVLVGPLIQLLTVDDPAVREQASAALTTLPQAIVNQSLVAVVADASASEAGRLAAIDVLRRGIHRWEIVGPLMQALPDAPDAVAVRIMDAMTEVTTEPLGRDRAAWQQWWKTRQSQGKESWLEAQVAMLSEHQRRLVEQEAQARAAADQRIEALLKKVGGLQEELFSVLPDDQKDAKLIAWLSDPLSEVCGHALSIIYRRIGDRSEPPSDAVRKALAGSLNRSEPGIRRQALLILGAVKEPQDATMVLDRLAKEPDLPTRARIFAVLGQLKNPAAVPALNAEISTATSDRGCVIEAAKALAEIAGTGQPDPPEALKTSVQPLVQRFAQAPAEDTELRVAVLSAMAAIADPAFGAQFLAAVDRSEPAYLKSALKGLARIGDRQKLERIRVLTAFKDDSLVRQAACEALGALGNADADLEVLQVAFKPTETQPTVREAAWQAFRRVLAARPSADQLAWMDRLNDMPERQIQFLSGQVSDPSGTDGHDQTTEPLRERLADLLLKQGRYGEAEAHLAFLYKSLLARKDSALPRIGVKLFDARLRSGRHENIADLVMQIIKAGPDPDKPPPATAGLAPALKTYLESEDAKTRADRTTALMQQLRAIPADALGDAWKQLVFPAETKPPDAKPAAEKPGDTKTPDAKPPDAKPQPVKPDAAPAKPASPPDAKKPPPGGGDAPGGSGG